MDANSGIRGKGFNTKETKVRAAPAFEMQSAECRVWNSKEQKGLDPIC